MVGFFNGGRAEIARGQALVPHIFGTVLTDVHLREQTLILSTNADKMSSTSDTPQKKPT